jgi:hypothetical protein
MKPLCSFLATATLVALSVAVPVQHAQVPPHKTPQESPSPHGLLVDGGPTASGPVPAVVLSSMASGEPSSPPTGRESAWARLWRVFYGATDSLLPESCFCAGGVVICRTGQGVNSNYGICGI